MHASRRNDIVVFLATGCFIGFFPVMPGTWGTIAAIPLVMLAHKGGLTLELISAVSLVLFAVGIAGKAEVLLAARDARPIVIDEVAGFVITLTWLPLSPAIVCLGFVLFRLFDIVKPPPIGTIERRLKSGWGVVMDDVVAGVYSNVCLRMLLTVAGIP